MSTEHLLIIIGIGALAVMALAWAVNRRLDQDDFGRREPHIPWGLEYLIVLVMILMIILYASSPVPPI